MKNDKIICIIKKIVVPLQQKQLTLLLTFKFFTTMKKTIFSIVCMVALALGMTSCGAVGIVGFLIAGTTGLLDSATATVS